MQKFMIFGVFAALVYLIPNISYWSSSTPDQWNEETTLYKVLIDLGEEKPLHYIEPTPEQIQQGKDITLRSYTTTASGKRTSPVSKYFMCTSCHNVNREDPNLRFSDPETRLPYVKEKGLPFLQGTTLWGIVNRESWYNDDYIAVHGNENTRAAHKDLRKSIQLCAIECSQGRYMDDWEIESVLAYYWDLQYKMKDLELESADWEKLKAESKDATNHESLRKWLKTFYLQKAPATFFDAPKSKKEGYSEFVGRAEVGRDIYDLNCLWCHNDQNPVSHYILDDNKLSFKHLNRMVTKESHFSIYQLIAYGTFPLPGRRPYMPHYPLEKMSKQQVEDLRTYIEFRAKGGDKSTLSENPTSVGD